MVVYYVPHHTRYTLHTLRPPVSLAFPLCRSHSTPPLRGNPRYAPSLSLPLSHTHLGEDDEEAGVEGVVDGDLAVGREELDPASAPEERTSAVRLTKRGGTGGKVQPGIKTD